MCTELSQTEHSVLSSMQSCMLIYSGSEYLCIYHIRALKVAVHDLFMGEQSSEETKARLCTPKIRFQPIQVHLQPQTEKQKLVQPVFNHSSLLRCPFVRPHNACTRHVQCFSSIFLKKQNVLLQHILFFWSF